MQVGLLVLIRHSHGLRWCCGIQTGGRHQKALFDIGFYYSADVEIPTKNNYQNKAELDLFS